MLPSLLAQTAGALADLLLPPACALCGLLLQRPDQVACTECQAELEPLQTPLCARCGQPHAGSGLCPQCHGGEYRLELIRAPLAFGESVQRAVLGLKVGRKTRLAPFLAGLIAAAELPDLRLSSRQLLVPVPLHQDRLRSRGFNQSALIARELSRLAGVPNAPLHLVRTRPTPSQSEMKTRQDRLKNVAGAFAVMPRHPFSEKDLCLVDDVVTTGATLESCAGELLRAGARSVVAVAVARAIRW